MLDEHRTLAGLESLDAGPMPGVIGAAVSRRRVARRVRRAGVVVVCLAVVGAVTLWSMLPGQHPLDPEVHLVDGAEGPSTGVRFAEESILAMRMAGLEDGLPVAPAPREAPGRGEATLFGLRERELALLGSPAS